MAQFYTTTQTEPVDLICWRHYGRSLSTVEAVLEANPSLANTAHAVPPGTQIVLPDVALAESAGQPRLWD